MGQILGFYWLAGTSFLIDARKPAILDWWTYWAHRMGWKLVRIWKDEALLCKKEGGE